MRLHPASDREGFERGLIRMDPAPRRGDLLISKRPASHHYEISQMPGPPQILAVDYASAIARASGLANRAAVRVWETKDSVFFTCLKRDRD